MSSKVALLLMSLLLVGCAPQAIRQADSPWYRLPVGSELVLRRDLPLRARHARVFLQFGEVAGQGNLDQYYPSCNFEMRTLHDQPSQIRAGTFRVTGFSEGYEQLVHSTSPALTRPQLALVFVDHASLSVNRYVHYPLAAPEQPDLLRFTCRGGQADLPEALPPSLGEIRQTVGDWLEIRPAN